MQVLDEKYGKLADPYLQIPTDTVLSLHDVATSQALRAALQDKLEISIERILQAMERREFGDLPGIVGSLDNESGGMVTVRIRNMLLGFTEILHDNEKICARLSSVFHPLESWVSGRHCITSPALLTLQATLFSHAEWRREEAHEAYSALRTYRELIHAGFPESDAEFVAVVVAHQTLLRAAWSADQHQTPPEVIPFYRRNGEIKFVTASGDQQSDGSDIPQRLVGRGLARTLFNTKASDRKPMQRRQLAAALVLQALCLCCRHGRKLPANFNQITDMALPFVDHLLARGSVGEVDEGSVRLAFVQYGRYVHDAQQHQGDASGSPFAGALDRIAEEVSIGKEWRNVTFTFQRVSSRRAWAGVSIESKKEPGDEGQSENPTEQRRAFVESREFVLGNEGGPAKSIAESAGNIWACSLDKIDYIMQALHLNDEPTRQSMSQWLNQSNHNKVALAMRDVFKAYDIQRASNKKYLPAPLVGHVLRQMRDVKPADFSPLHIHTRTREDGGYIADRTSVVWLPRLELRDMSSKKTVDTIWANGDSDWANGDSEHAAHLVARYVASLIVAHTVALSPLGISLDFFTLETENQWDDLIRIAVRENGGPTMEAFITQMNCAPTRLNIPDPLGVYVDLLAGEM